MGNLDIINSDPEFSQALTIISLIGNIILTIIKWECYASSVHSAVETLKVLSEAIRIKPQIRRMVHPRIFLT